MNSVLRANTSLFQHSEEVCGVDERHRELLSLCLHVLFVGDVFEELLSGLACLQELHHEHDHDLYGLLVQLTQVKLLVLLLLLLATSRLS